MTHRLLNPADRSIIHAVRMGEKNIMSATVADENLDAHPGQTDFIDARRRSTRVGVFIVSGNPPQIEGILDQPENCCKQLSAKELVLHAQQRFGELLLRLRAVEERLLRNEPRQANPFLESDTQARWHLSYLEEAVRVAWHNWMGSVYRADVVQLQVMEGEPLAQTYARLEQQRDHFDQQLAVFEGYAGIGN